MGSTKSRFAGCFSLGTSSQKRGGRVPDLEEWSDNRALKEAEMQPLTKE